MHRAAQRVGVAVALQKPTSRGHTLVAIGVDPHHQFGVARLDGRVHQVAGEHRRIATAPGTDCEVIRRVAWGRGQPNMIVERMVASLDSHVREKT